MLYYIDLGFDWNATPSAGNMYYLQSGVVDMNGNPQPVPGTLSGLSAGDTLMFNIYDLTQNCSGQPAPADVQPAITTTWMTSVVADTSTPSGSTGFSNFSDIQNATVGRVDAAQGTSAYFQGAPSKVWPIIANSTALVANVTNPNGNNAPACYRLTWTLSVTSQTNNQTRTYTDDPEMIVKP